MQPGDILLIYGPGEKWLIWEIEGIYLGGLGQESVVHLQPLSMLPNHISGDGSAKTIVPVEMIEAGIVAGLWVRLPAPVRPLEIQPGQSEARGATVVVREVHGTKANDHLGYEFTIGENIYFYAANQRAWPGLRGGPFPNDTDGIPFGRTPLFATSRQGSGE